MTAHSCTTLDPSCYRCDLGRDEVEAERPEATDYPASWDRIYPRCPACSTEQYALAVLAFSAGEHGCWSCDHVIREDARLVESNP